MDFKTMAITATLGGTILLSGLTFTGTLNLTDIKNFGTDWASKITQAVDNSKDMASKFSLFKSDAEQLLNEKIALINSLNAQIADLNNKVGSGEMNLSDANNEIARLNEQLEIANNEVQALKDEFALKDTEVQTAFSEMVTAESLDTTLNLDEQTGTPAPPEQTPEETPEETEQTSDFTAQETAIKNALASKITVLDNLTVTMTDTTITLTEEHINLADTAVIKGEINKIIGKVPTGPTKNGNTHTYTY
jgi:chromosome segregation ATPase